MTALVIFAIVAFIIVHKLFTILGEVPEDDTKRIKVIKAETISELESNLPPELQTKVNKIKTIDSGFDLDRFINGAKAAYSMIIRAHANKDFSVLKKLLSDNLYKTFVEISETTSEHRIDSIEFKTINNINLNGNLVMITLLFDIKEIINLGKVQSSKQELTFVRHFSLEDIWKLSKINVL